MQSTLNRCRRKQLQTQLCPKAGFAGYRLLETRIISQAFLQPLEAGVDGFLLTWLTTKGLDLFGRECSSPGESGLRAAAEAKV